MDRNIYCPVQERALICVISNFPRDMAALCAAGKRYSCDEEFMKPAISARGAPCRLVAALRAGSEVERIRFLLGLTPNKALNAAVAASNLTPLMWAVKLQRADAVSLIVNVASDQAPDYGPQTAVIDLEAKPNDGVTAFVLACNVAQKCSIHSSDELKKEYRLAAEIAATIGNHGQIKPGTSAGAQRRRQAGDLLWSSLRTPSLAESTNCGRALSAGLISLVKRWMAEQPVALEPLLNPPNPAASLFETAQVLATHWSVALDLNAEFRDFATFLASQLGFDFTQRTEKYANRFMWAAEEGHVALVQKWLANPRCTKEFLGFAPIEGDHAFAFACRKAVEQYARKEHATIARLIAESPYGTPALIGGWVSNLVWAWQAGLRDICFKWLTHEDCGEEEVNSGLDGQLFYSSCKDVWNAELFDWELPAKMSFAEGLARHVRPATPGPNGGTNLLWARLAGLKIAQAWEYDSAWSRGYVAPLPAKATTDAETTPFPMLCSQACWNPWPFDDRGVPARARALAIAVAASPHCKPMQVDSNGTSNLQHACLAGLTEVVDAWLEGTAKDTAIPPEVARFRKRSSRACSSLSLTTVLHLFQCLLLAVCVVAWWRLGRDGLVNELGLCPDSRTNQQ